MNAAYSQLDIGRRIKITWQRSSDTTVRDTKIKSKLLKKEKNKCAQGWRAKGWENKYLNILEIFAVRAGPSKFLIRSLRLIICYKYQLVFILTAVILGIRLRNHFLILVLLSVNVSKAVTYFKEPAG